MRPPAVATRGGFPGRGLGRVACTMLHPRLADISGIRAIGMTVKRDQARSSRPAAASAERWFFPAAALYGAVAVPLSVYGMLGGEQRLPGLAAPAAHAHELVFGYALAVVAGYLIGRASVLRLAILLGLWIAARASYLIAPHGLSALILNIAFAGALALTAAPRLIRAAKKWRNRFLGPLIVALAIAVAAFHLASVAKAPSLQVLALRESVLLLALLMMFMGGRIIAPAVAGAIERAGGRLEARVQPRIEGALLVILLAAVLSSVMPHAGVVAGICLIAAGVLAAVRLLRWRLWRCWRRTDLLCLGAGYGWLAVGLVLLGSARLGAMPIGAATHGVTIGALGTLTTAVMARVYLVKNGGRPEHAGRALSLMALAMSAAAVVRIAGGGAPGTLWFAAALWSAALVLLLDLLRRVRP